MSKKNGNKSSKKQQNNGAFSPIALGLVRRTYPKLLSNALVGVDSMTPEEKAKWEKEWRERCKEEHINEIKHSGDFWKL